MVAFIKVSELPSVLREEANYDFSKMEHQLIMTTQ